MLIDVKELFSRPEAALCEGVVRQARLGSRGRGVPRGPDVHLEVKVWVREMNRTGHRPPYDKGAWLEHAHRMGMGPDDAALGWRLISKGKLEQSEHVYASESLYGGQVRGYYIQPPQSTRIANGEPPFTFQSKAATDVYQVARKIAAKSPDTTINNVYARAMKAVGAKKLSKEDDAVMSLAITWELSGKDAPPAPPPVGTQRSAWGMKGTQATSGRSVAPRGAP